MSARIELNMKEYQGMNSKIKNLENALNSVSKEAAANKEKLEQVKALVADLENEGFLNRLFGWKAVIRPFKELFDTKTI
jgi:septal ring factor EnvC (AmiA/AmiB activator)